MATPRTKQQRDYQRWARRGTTTQRGLDGKHQSARQTALATMTEGQFCARCLMRGIEHPMSRSLITRSADGKRWKAPMLHLDDFPGRIYGGPQVKRLSYASCNCSAGATLGNTLRGAAKRWSSARQW